MWHKVTFRPWAHALSAASSQSNGKEDNEKWMERIQLHFYSRYKFNYTTTWMWKKSSFLFLYSSDTSHEILKPCVMKKIHINPLCFKLCLEKKCTASLGLTQSFCFFLPWYLSIWVRGSLDFVTLRKRYLARDLGQCPWTADLIPRCSVATDICASWTYSLFSLNLDRVHSQLSLVW